MSCVYIFFSTCPSCCVASASWFVFVFVFITTFLFDYFFSCEFDTYLWHGALVICMTLLIFLSSFSICMFLILIPAYVYLNKHTHFPALPYSYTFIAIFVCFFGCILFYIYTHLFVFFLHSPKHNRHLCYDVY